MIPLQRREKPSSNFTSQLHDEKTFYNAFIKDLNQAAHEVIIESPYITNYRMQQLWPVLRTLISREVKVYIITKAYADLDENLQKQSAKEIHKCETLGIQVLLCLGNHHRKLAMIDRRVLWEGSLNILSQMNSREIMRRMDSEVLAIETFKFLQFDKYI